MSEMVERVRLAIIEVWQSDAHDAPVGTYLDTERVARAAIAAMREPTREMEMAGATGSGEGSEQVALGAWEAMIDAALKDA